MSRSVRAGLVVRMPCWVRTSRQCSVRETWVRIPFGRRSIETVISNGLPQRFRQPQLAIAELWESDAVGPPASTAAAARSSGVFGGRPTA